MEMPEEKRHAMSVKAAEFASRFSVKRTTTDLIQVYEWLLGKSSRPACVTIE
jgi:hypothetical protein